MLNTMESVASFDQIAIRELAEKERVRGEDARSMEAEARNVHAN